MWKLNDKSCMINQLRTLEYVWVQLLLFRTSRQFRNYLVIWRDQLRALCKDESLCEDLNLYCYQCQPKEFYYEDNYQQIINRIINLDFMVRVTIHVFPGSAPFSLYKILELQAGQKFRVKSLQVKSDFDVEDRIHKYLNQYIAQMFGIKEYNIKLRITNLPIDEDLALIKYKHLTLVLSSSMLVYFQVEELLNLKKLNIMVESSELFQIIFSDLSQKYPLTKFVVTIINPNIKKFEKFYENYRELFTVQDCKLKLEIKENKEFEDNLEYMFDKIYNQIPQNIRIKLKLSQKYFNSRYLGLFQHRMEGRLEISEFNFYKHDSFYSQLQVRSFNFNQSECMPKLNLNLASIAQFKIKEQLDIKINQSIIVSPCDAVLKSPKYIKIDCRGCSNWNEVINSILLSLTEVELIIGLQIQIDTAFHVEERQKEAINSIYEFIDRCRSIQKLDIPYINEASSLALLREVLDSKQDTLKYLKLKLMRIDGTLGLYGGGFNLMHELITHVSKNMHQLRYIDVDVFCSIDYVRNNIDTFQLMNIIKPINVRIGFFGNKDHPKELLYGSKLSQLVLYE
ncbi:hypothetical protein FGO68_gene635 [Halteria grandinella]|uniref:Uncharacterized protein n=1 Tax=Halteria grandinella TaxID=5974 RepID=A0A8J8NS90_HALGN|nr:hypothetical protein FGO68_gene635 [Halteria grandinella]